MEIKGGREEQRRRRLRGKVWWASPEVIIWAWACLKVIGVLHFSKRRRVGWLQMGLWGLMDLERVKMDGKIGGTVNWFFFSFFPQKNHEFVPFHTKSIFPWI